MRFLSPALAIALIITYMLRVCEVVPDGIATPTVGALALALVVSTTIQAILRSPHQSSEDSA